MPLDPVDYVVDLGDDLVGSSITIVAWVISLWFELGGTAILYHLPESRRIGQMVVASLHSVAGHLQVLTGVVMNAVESFVVRCVVGSLLLLVRRSPEQKDTGQAKLPPKHHVNRRRACGLVGRSSVGQ
jgi:hypothetical protein